MGELKDNCGIAAVRLKKPIEKYPEGSAAYYLHIMLLALQHRGKESAGIGVFNPHSVRKIRVHKNLGTVNSVFSVDDISKYRALLRVYEGVAGIGHVRYSTSRGNGCGKQELLDQVQPFYRRHGKSWKRFLLAFNGNLDNMPELTKMLNSKDYDIETGTDTEVLMHLLAIEMRSAKRTIPAIRRVVEFISGAYSTAYLNGKGELAVFRDPKGFKPLCYAEDERMLAAASESVALTRIGFEHEQIKYLEPGFVLKMRYNFGEGRAVRSKRRVARTDRRGECMFERVYFAHVSSLFEEGSIREIRQRLGILLARKDVLAGHLDGGYIVAPVPQTAITATEAYARALGVAYDSSAIIKNDSLGRGFITPEEARDFTICNKFNVTPNAFAGKKVILVDDSIVRSDTSRRLISAVRKVGRAEEVHMRSTCPPIRYPCFNGIDFPTRRELAVYKAGNPKSKEDIEMRIAQMIGADTMQYQSLEGLLGAIGLPKSEMCVACIDGEYLTNYARRRFEESE